MKLLLLCLGLTLACAHHEDNHDVVTSNFDMSKLSGEWYTILLASGVKEMVEEQGSFRIFVDYIQALDNSSVLLKCHKMINRECAELTLIFDETEEEGLYSATYLGYNEAHILEAVYNDYVIFYYLNYHNDEITQGMELHARNPDVSPQIKKRFEEICENTGIPKENVVDVSNADRCPKQCCGYGWLQVDDHRLAQVLRETPGNGLRPFTTSPMPWAHMYLQCIWTGTWGGYYLETEFML
ncbi:major allergen Equ c 1-like [Phyllostomus discolor]|uniref:Major allergen Equ c 1-like n=1 Tax=Phyllostomus discolor TaxID=89673 RepID=A0A7E6DG02_9CHIR|nr:major allergen Equ c 1-like [Phyllostomus discolor]